MPRSRSLTVVSMLAVLLTLIVEAPALANTIVRTDGNDAKGPLDLASVRVTHTTGGSVFRVTTLARFTNKQVNGKQGFFEIDFDTNGDRNPNYFVVVLRRAGKMRGWLFKGNGDLITRKLAASRAPRSARVTVPLSRIGKPKSYDFAAFSAFFAKPCTSSHPCIDSIPNRYPLVRHDLTAPTFSWNPLPPTYSSEVSATLTFQVGFSVADDSFGSGVKDWTLQKRAVGTSTWTFVAAGTALNPTRNVTGAEGVSYDLRVIVRDKQGNRTIGALARTSVPYDDTNPLFSYDTPTRNSSVSGAFLGTTTGILNGQGMTFGSQPGAAQLCILTGPTSGPTATADVKVNGSVVTTLSEDGTTPAMTRTCVGTVDDDVIEVATSTAESFVFDGAFLVPV